MKRSLRSIVYLMIVVLAAGGIYLWSLGGTNQDVLGGLNPETFDVEATCSSMENHMLICNAGNDNYLFLDGTEVYKQKTKTEIKENGDEETKVSYKASSLSKLEKKLADGEATLHMWLTKTGKVRAIMIIESAYENNNASLAYLDGLKPGSHTLSAVILKMDKHGMKLAPLGYTEAEKDKFAGMVSSYKFARGVKFYNETITITVDADGSRHKNTQYGKNAYRDVKAGLGKGSNAYVWLNKYGNVSAVMTFNEKVVLK